MTALGIWLRAAVNPAELGVNRAYRAAYRPGVGRVMFFRCSRHRAAQQLVVTAAMEAMVGRAPVAGRVRVELELLFARLHRTGPARGLAVGDVDGPIKAVLDALEEAGVMADDGQVVEVSARKGWGKPPSLTVTVEELGP